MEKNSKEQILGKLSATVGGSDKELFAQEELNAFAEHYSRDDEVTHNLVSNFLSYWWDTPSLCRRCSICGRLMTAGYCYNYGQQYFCSDKCLHTHFSDAEWQEECRDNEQSYYTEWR